MIGIVRPSESTIAYLSSMFSCTSWNDVHDGRDRRHNAASAIEDLGFLDAISQPVVLTFMTRITPLTFLDSFRLPGHQTIELVG